MAKKKTELSDKQRKCLETLREQWENENYNAFSPSLSAADLRLLLEHFPPVRALIRSITQGCPAEEKTEPLAMPDAEAELKSVLAEREQQISQLTIELKAAIDKAAHMDAESRKYQRALRKAQMEQESLARQIDDLRHQPQLGKAGEVLAFLCGRNDLQKRLGLEGLSGDAEGVVRMVAVLAQKENIVRLLEMLGEAAQKRKAPALPEECALLEAAVGWLNHSWKSKPYRLIQLNAGDKFDYDAHRRANYTPTGETIVSVLAPGLQNGAGGLELKPIVATG